MAGEMAKQIPKARYAAQMKMSNSRKSSASWYGWNILPDPIFGDIMMMVGLNNSRRIYLSEMFSNCSLDNMHKCRQVCQSWNVMISQTTEYKKDNIKSKVENFAGQIRAKWVMWEVGIPLNTIDEIVPAASLAHHGLLGSVERIVLQNIDLRYVPAKHLASLASCTTEGIAIWNVWISDMSPILDNINCEVVSIQRNCLNSEETQALLRVMASRVGRVYLHGDVSLDITALTQYNGTGRCWGVVLLRDTADKLYTKKMKRWSRRIDWIVPRDDDEALDIQRMVLISHETFFLLPSPLYKW